MPLRDGRPMLSAMGPVADTAWLRIWADAFDPDARLFIVTDGNGTPLARLALCRERRGPRGLMRTLRSPTNGQALYAGLRLDPAAPEDSARRLLAAAAALPGWDFMRLQGLTEDGLHPLMAAAASLGLTPEIERHFFHHRIDLAAMRAGTLPLPMGGDTRRRKDRQLRALEKEGQVTFLRATGAEECLPALERYMAAERSSWKATGGELLTDSAGLMDFYRNVMRLPGAEVWLLELDDQPIAGTLMRRAAGELACLKTFYDAALNRFSPGALIQIRYFRHHLEDPETNVIDLCSGKDAYRYLATHQAQLADLTIWNRGVRPFLLRTARQLGRRLRKAPAAQPQPAPAEAPEAT